ncbi:hypothetical protein FRC15_009533 [Serendipita sp. 397]|nr:hypothetical protein FRC15_009533 [Serendipita sp. 397]
MPLATIPAEIQEAIILETAILSPRTLSSLSKTCRVLNRLISKPKDQHLWRRIFLAIFDDPRPALRLDPHTHHKSMQKRKNRSPSYQSNNGSGTEQSGTIQSGGSMSTTTTTTTSGVDASTSVDVIMTTMTTPNERERDVVDLDWKTEAQRRFRATIRMETVASADLDEFDAIVDEDVVDALMDLALFALPTSEAEMEAERLGSSTPLKSKRLDDEEDDEDEEDEDEEEVEEESGEGGGRGGEEVELEEREMGKGKEREKGERKGNKAYLEDCLRSAILPLPLTQKRAQLHILCSFLKVYTSVSIPISTYLIGFRSRGSRLRLDSRAYTYNLSNYKEENHYGPWLPSSSGEEQEEDAVNYIHLWHLINVIRYNSYERNSFELPTIGIDGWRAFSAPRAHLIREPPTEEEEEKEESWNDWAGVQGVWCRAISFMDYRDLHSYNFTNRNEDGTRKTTIFEQVQFAEAFRLIKAYFTVTKVEETGPAHHPDRPRIHFVGDTALFSHPGHAHAMSVLNGGGNGNGVGGGTGVLASDTSISIHRITKGTVSMTPAGAIRWSFSTRVGGHEWASEGTQIGQVQSRAGVVGVWTSAEHEDGDPAGPFWMWKVGEGAKKVEPKLEQLHYHFVFEDD